MANTKHIIFDIGNVMINFDLTVLIDRIYRETGKSKLEFTRILTRLRRQLVEVETGRISDDAFFAHCTQVTGLQWGREDWVRAWTDIYSINHPGRDLFLELHTLGRPVHLLSNLAEHNMEAIKRVDPTFFDFGQHHFFSFQMGAHKPDPAIYRQACAILDAPSENCFFLDDLKENVNGAREIGMQAMRFSNADLPHIRDALASF